MWSLTTINITMQYYSFSLSLSTYLPTYLSTYPSLCVCLCVRVCVCACVCACVRACVCVLWLWTPCAPRPNTSTPLWLDLVCRKTPNWSKPKDVLCAFCSISHCLSPMMIVYSPLKETSAHLGSTMPCTDQERIHYNTAVHSRWMSWVSVGSCGVRLRNATSSVTTAVNKAISSLCVSLGLRLGLA